MPQVPAEAVMPLQLAAAECQAALAPCGANEAERLLMALRSSTIIRNETLAEAQQSFKVMVTHLARIPQDILRQAVDAYVRAPGQRFFPRSTGELMSFVGPLMLARQRAAYRFRIMAAQAAAAADEAKRLAVVNPIPDEEIASWSPSMRTTALAKGWITQDQFDNLAAHSEA